MITKNIKYILATVLLCLGIGGRAENMVTISSVIGIRHFKKQMLIKMVLRLTSLKIKAIVIIKSFITQ